MDDPDPPPAYYNPMLRRPITGMEDNPELNRRAPPPQPHVASPSQPAPHTAPRPEPHIVEGRGGEVPPHVAPPHVVEEPRSQPAGARPPPVETHSPSPPRPQPTPQPPHIVETPKGAEVPKPIHPPQPQPPHTQPAPTQSPVATPSPSQPIEAPKPVPSPDVALAQRSQALAQALNEAQNRFQSALSAVESAVARAESVLAKAGQPTSQQQANAPPSPRITEETRVTLSPGLSQPSSQPPQPKPQPTAAPSSFSGGGGTDFTVRRIGPTTVIQSATGDKTTVVVPSQSGGQQTVTVTTIKGGTTTTKVILPPPPSNPPVTDTGIGPDFTVSHKGPATVIQSATGDAKIISPSQTGNQQTVTVTTIKGGTTTTSIVGGGGTIIQKTVSGSGSGGGGSGGGTKPGGGTGTGVGSSLPPPIDPSKLNNAPDYVRDAVNKLLANGVDVYDVSQSGDSWTIWFVDSSGNKHYVTIRRTVGGAPGAETPPLFASSDLWKYSYGVYSGGDIAADVLQALAARGSLPPPTGGSGVSVSNLPDPVKKLVDYLQNNIGLQIVGARDLGGGAYAVYAKAADGTIYNIVYTNGAITAYDSKGNIIGRYIWEPGASPDLNYAFYQTTLANVRNRPPSTVDQLALSLGVSTDQALVSYVLRAMDFATLASIVAAYLGSNISRVDYATGTIVLSDGRTVQATIKNGHLYIGNIDLGDVMSTLVQSALSNMADKLKQMYGTSNIKEVGDGYVVFDNNVKVQYEIKDGHLYLGGVDMGAFQPYVVGAIIAVGSDIVNNIDKYLQNAQTNAFGAKMFEAYGHRWIYDPYTGRLYLADGVTVDDFQAGSSYGIPIGSSGTISKQFLGIDVAEGSWYHIWESAVLSRSNAQAVINQEVAIDYIAEIGKALKDLGVPYTFDPSSGKFIVATPDGKTVSISLANDGLIIGDKLYPYTVMTYTSSWPSWPVSYSRSVKDILNDYFTSYYAGLAGGPVERSQGNLYLPNIPSVAPMSNNATAVEVWAKGVYGQSAKVEQAGDNKYIVTYQAGYGREYKIELDFDPSTNSWSIKPLNAYVAVDVKYAVGGNYYVLSKQIDLPLDDVTAKGQLFISPTGEVYALYNGKAYALKNGKWVETDVKDVATALYGWTMSGDFPLRNPHATAVETEVTGLSVITETTVPDFTLARKPGLSPIRELFAAPENGPEIGASPTRKLIVVDLGGGQGIAVDPNTLKPVAPVVNIGGKWVALPSDKAQVVAVPATSSPNAPPDYVLSQSNVKYIAYDPEKGYLQLSGGTWVPVSQKDALSAVLRQPVEQVGANKYAVGQGDVKVLVSVDGLSVKPIGISVNGHEIDVDPRLAKINVIHDDTYHTNIYVVWTPGAAYRVIGDSVEKIDLSNVTYGPGYNPPVVWETVKFVNGIEIPVAYAVGPNGEIQAYLHNELGPSYGPEYVPLVRDGKLTEEARNLIQAYGLKAEEFNKLLREAYIGIYKDVLKKKYGVFAPVVEAINAFMSGLSESPIGELPAQGALYAKALIEGKSPQEEFAQFAQFKWIAEGANPTAAKIGQLAGWGATIALAILGGYEAAIAGAASGGATGAALSLARAVGTGAGVNAVLTALGEALSGNKIKVEDVAKSALVGGLLMPMSGPMSKLSLIASLLPGVVMGALVGSKYGAGQGLEAGSTFFFLGAMGAGAAEGLRGGEEGGGAVDIVKRAQELNVSPERYVEAMKKVVEWATSSPDVDPVARDALLRTGGFKDVSDMKNVFNAIADVMDEAIKVLGEKAEGIERDLLIPVDKAKLIEDFTKNVARQYEMWLGSERGTEVGKTLGVSSETKPPVIDFSKMQKVKVNGVEYYIVPRDDVPEFLANLASSVKAYSDAATFRALRTYLYQEANRDPQKFIELLRGAADNIKALLSSDAVARIRDLLERSGVKPEEVDAYLRDVQYGVRMGAILTAQTFADVIRELPENLRDEILADLAARYAAEQAAVAAINRYYGGWPTKITEEIDEYELGDELGEAGVTPDKTGVGPLDLARTIKSRTDFIDMYSEFKKIATQLDILKIAKIAGVDPAEIDGKFVDGYREFLDGKYRGPLEGVYERLRRAGVTYDELAKAYDKAKGYLPLMKYFEALDKAGISPEELKELVDKIKNRSKALAQPVEEPDPLAKYILSAFTPEELEQALIRAIEGGDRAVLRYFVPERDADLLRRFIEAGGRLRDATRESFERLLGALGDEAYRAYLDLKLRIRELTDPRVRELADKIRKAPLKDLDMWRDAVDTSDLPSDVKEALWNLIDERERELTGKATRARVAGTEEAKVRELLDRINNAKSIEELDKLTREISSMGLTREQAELLRESIETKRAELEGKAPKKGVETAKEEGKEEEKAKETGVAEKGKGGGEEAVVEEMEKERGRGERQRVEEVEIERERGREGELGVAIERVERAPVAGRAGSVGVFAAPWLNEIFSSIEGAGVRQAGELGIGALYRAKTGPMLWILGVPITDFYVTEVELNGVKYYVGVPTTENTSVQYVVVPSTSNVAYVVTNTGVQTINVPATSPTQTQGTTVPVPSPPTPPQAQPAQISGGGFAPFMPDWLTYFGRVADRLKQYMQREHLRI